MNQAHFHLMVNHLPIILPIAGVVVLVGGMFVRSEIVKRMAYLLFTIGAVAAFLQCLQEKEQKKLLKTWLV